MIAKVSTVPLGALEGVPCLELTCDAVVPADDLRHILAGEIRSGIQVIWLKDCPWGDPDLDDALLRLMADTRYQGIKIVALRDVESTSWLGIDIDWIGDCSKWLAEPTRSDDIQVRALAMPYVPRLEEIVAVCPARVNLQPPVLDELFGTFDPACGAWLYVPDDGDLVSLAGEMSSRCTTPWGVRRHIARQETKAS